MIPSWEKVMLPTLKLLADGVEHQRAVILNKTAESFGLSEDELCELLPSGVRIFDNRVSWGLTFLKKAELICSTRRAFYSITDRGRELLKEKPTELTSKSLMRYPEFAAFQASKPRTSDETKGAQEIITSKTPEEQLEDGYQRYHQELAAELLDQVKSGSPAFFETLVIDLLTKMGYGGTRKDAGQAMGRTGDGGIDGLIKEDRLGLDTIYIQAKRWENIVPVKEVRDFAGALLYKKAKKGIFITTSSFPKSAEDFVKGIDPKVILIDGLTLADYMIENGVGLTLVNIYSIYRIDADYFEE